MSPAICRLLYVPSTVAVAGMAIAFGSKPVTFPKPEALTRFTTDDKTLSFEHPANWKPHDTAVRDQVTEMWVEPTRLVRFYVKADFVSSLYADVDRANAAQAQSFAESAGGLTGQSGEQHEAPKDPSKTALIKRHEAQREKLEKQFAHYEEGEAEEKLLGFRQAIVSSFTFKSTGIWTQREMAGKRATMNPGDRVVTMICYCPKEMESELGPLFDKMMASVRPEGGK